VYTSILNVKREKGKSLGGVLPIGLFRDTGKGGSCEMKQSQIFSSGSPKKLTSVFMLIVFALVVGIGTPMVSFAAEEESSPSNDAALGVGSFFLTLVYAPVKMVYAILGGVVGGFTYALTGGDLETAQGVWEPSVYGTYVITPDHLKGNEPVRFFGVSAYEEETYLSERVD
jgi:hypothetical protein